MTSKIRLSWKIQNLQGTAKWANNHLWMPLTHLRTNSKSCKKLIKSNCRFRIIIALKKMCTASGIMSNKLNLQMQKQMPQVKSLWIKQMIHLLIFLAKGAQIWKNLKRQALSKKKNYQNKFKKQIQIIETRIIPKSSKNLITNSFQFCNIKQIIWKKIENLKTYWNWIKLKGFLKTEAIHKAILFFKKTFLMH